MTRSLRIGAAQLGPIQQAEPRAEVVARLMALMEKAADAGCELVVYPELALTTFFPRWILESQEEIDRYFEPALPGPETAPLFALARQRRIGFYLGYAELAEEKGEARHYNSAVLVDREGGLVGKYRKIHLPGHAEPDPQRSHQHLEKRYFDVGNLGFPVWPAFGGRVGMAICNDRRWPETYRVMAMADVELVLIGYNTPTADAFGEEGSELRAFHNRLTLQAGAYQNSTWVVAVAKAGLEDGHALMGGSSIVAPTGEIVAEAASEADELIVADCDLDRCLYYKAQIFDFGRHRRPEHYGPILARAARQLPDD